MYAYRPHPRDSPGRQTRSAASGSAFTRRPTPSGHAALTQTNAFARPAVRARSTSALTKLSGSPATRGTAGQRTAPLPASSVYETGPSPIACGWIETGRCASDRSAKIRSNAKLRISSAGGRKIRRSNSESSDRRANSSSPQHCSRNVSVLSTRKKRSGRPPNVRQNSGSRLNNASSRNSANTRTTPAVGTAAAVGTTPAQEQPRASASGRAAQPFRVAEAGGIAIIATAARTPRRNDRAKRELSQKELITTSALAGIRSGETPPSEGPSGFQLPHRPLRLRSIGPR